jgi:hypothetical protein
MQALEKVEGGALPPPLLRPLTFIDKGGNTAPEITKAHIYQNVQRELPWLEAQSKNDKSLVIVAGGPSLKYRWEEILEHKDADILALNNTYGFLLERGIVPTYFMLLDARQENIDFIKNTHKGVKHYLAAQCHPDIFEALTGHDVALYLTTHPETMGAVKDIKKPKVRLGGPVGTVGIKALSLAYALGYRDMHLYGYDSSYEDGAHHAYAQTLNDQSKTIEVYLDGKKYITTPAMAQQATEFCGLVKDNFLTHGCNIELHCNGLLPAVVAHNNKLGEIPLEQREREKYEKIWTHDAYRKSAPGEQMVEHAIETLEIHPGDSLIDFGCGTGRASAKFRSLGIKVKSIDFASNCVDPGIELDFIQACLWDLPDIKADFGYCTDVMEHIPLEKVGDVLSGIAARCNGAYFNIATRDDSLGSLIGRKLHMTVMIAEGWRKLMEHYWQSVEMMEREGEVTFILKQPRR